MANIMFKVKDYYKHYLGIFGVLTTIVGATPLIALFVKSDWASYLFPPLGGIETFLKIATLILIVLLTLIIFFVKDVSLSKSKRGRLKVQVGLLLLSIFGLVSFGVLYLLVVEDLEIPGKGRISVSIGYDRTEFAKKNFEGETDKEMLEQRGLTDEEVFRLWTASSIIISRLALLISYWLFLLPAISVGSLSILFDKIGAADNE